MGVEDVRLALVGYRWFVSQVVGVAEIHKLLLEMAKTGAPNNEFTTMQQSIQGIVKDEPDDQKCSDAAIPAPTAPTSEPGPSAKSIGEKNPERKQPTRASKRNVGYVRRF